MELTEWLFQHRVWGWSLIGNEPDPRDALRNPAFIAEGYERDGWWDHDWTWLGFQKIDRGDGWQKVPDWWALAGWSWNTDATEAMCFAKGG